MCTIRNQLMLVVCYLECLYGHHRLFQPSGRLTAKWDRQWMSSLPMSRHECLQ